MRVIRWLHTALVYALTFLVGPLLPQALRRHWPWPDVLGGPWLQTLHAYLHAVAALVLYMTGLTLTVKEFGERFTEALMDPQHGTGDPSLLTWYGLIGFFAWLVSPLGLLAGLYLVDSVARAVNGAMHRTVPGTLFIALPLLALTPLRRAAEEARLVKRYGRPDLPDRLHARGENLFLRTSRCREEWHPLLTYSFGGKLYRLAWSGEVPEGERFCFEYRLEPWPDGSPVKRVVLLDPPKITPAL